MRAAEIWSCVSHAQDAQLKGAIRPDPPSGWQSLATRPWIGYVPLVGLSSRDLKNIEGGRRTLM